MHNCAMNLKLDNFFNDDKDVDDDQGSDAEVEDDDQDSGTEVEDEDEPETSTEPLGRRL